MSQRRHYPPPPLQQSSSQQLQVNTPSGTPSRDYFRQAQSPTTPQPTPSPHFQSPSFQAVSPVGFGPALFSTNDYIQNSPYSQYDMTDPAVLETLSKIHELHEMLKQQSAREDEINKMLQQKRQETRKASLEYNSSKTRYERYRDKAI